MRKQFISVLLAPRSDGRPGCLHPRIPERGSPRPPPAPRAHPRDPRQGPRVPQARNPARLNPAPFPLTPRRRRRPLPCPHPLRCLPDLEPGNAELAISVKPSEDGTAVNYTLVCKGGAPVAESQHPSAAAACAVLKENASPNQPAPRKNVSCTQQYGGPQEATVTGAVDGTPVETTSPCGTAVKSAPGTPPRTSLGPSGAA